MSSSPPWAGPPACSVVDRAVGSFPRNNPLGLTGHPGCSDRRMGLHEPHEFFPHYDLDEPKTFIEGWAKRAKRVHAHHRSRWLNQTAECQNGGHAAAEPAFAHPTIASLARNVRQDELAERDLHRKTGTKKMLRRSTRPRRQGSRSRPASRFPGSACCCCRIRRHPSRAE